MSSLNFENAPPPALIVSSSDSSSILVAVFSTTWAVPDEKSRTKFSSSVSSSTFLIWTGLAVSGGPPIVNFSNYVGPIYYILSNKRPVCIYLFPRKILQPYWTVLRQPCFYENWMKTSLIRIKLALDPLPPSTLHPLRLKFVTCNRN